MSTNLVRPISRPWRRYLRFSVRGLIVLVLLIGLAVGWLVRSAQIQRDAVSTIRRAGGVVWYHWQHGEPGADEALWAPEWLMVALGDDYFGHVVGVEIAKDASDAAIIQILHLPEVHDLSLNGPGVTDSGIAHLTELAKLTSLSFNGANLTDAGLAHLARLTGLSSLSLRNTKISDAGLAHLTRLTNLNELDVSRTEVSDAGLVHLRGLKKLEFLDLEGTRVTDAGVNELADALPNVEITR